MCPVDAIAIGRERPQLDLSSCVRCGACTPACPTEAIGSGPSRQPLHYAVADTPPGAAIVVACPRGGNTRASMPVIRHDRCLAALGGEELFDLAGEPGRELWLDDSPCATCELSRLQNEIASSVGRANGLLAVFGFDPTVHLGSEELPARRQTGTSPGVVVDARGGAMSRRAMFRRLFGEVADRLSVIEPDDDGVPPRRRRLLRALRRDRGTPPAGRTVDLAPADLGFGDVQVDPNRCTACGLCSRFCPTGALRDERVSRPDGREVFELAFRPASCVDCGVCPVACPEDAIVVEAGVDPVAVARGTSRIVARRRVVACEVCGLPTAETAVAMGRCFSCRAGVVSSLRDEAGLMSDLCSRVSGRGTG